MGDLGLKSLYHSRTIAIVRGSSATIFENAYRWTGAGQAVNKHDSVAIITAWCARMVQSRCKDRKDE